MESTPQQSSYSMETHVISSRVNRPVREAEDSRPFSVQFKKNYSCTYTLWSGANLKKQLLLPSNWYILLLKRSVLFWNCVETQCGRVDINCLYTLKILSKVIKIWTVEVIFVESENKDSEVWTLCYRIAVLVHTFYMWVSWLEPLVYVCMSSNIKRTSWSFFTVKILRLGLRAWGKGGRFINKKYNGVLSMRSSVWNETDCIYVCMLSVEWLPIFDHGNFRTLYYLCCLLLLQQIFGSVRTTAHSWRYKQLTADEG
jgi:hypothetical protein